MIEVVRWLLIILLIGSVGLSVETENFGVAAVNVMAFMVLIKSFDWRIR